MHTRTRSCAGIGKALMLAAQAYAREREDVDALWLHAEMEATGAIELYKKLGYRTMPTTREFTTFTEAVRLGPTTLLMKLECDSPVESQPAPSI